jgi:undecaprenyl-diphosphatase
MALLFVVLSAVVANGSFSLGDQLLLPLAQVPASSALDTLMTAVSTLGSLEVTYALMLILALTAGRGDRSPGLERWVPLAVMVLLNALELAAKSLVQQPAPPPALQRGLDLSIGSAVQTAFSYPSGHALRATIVYGIIGLRLFKRTGVIAWLFVSTAVILLVAFSRIYLASHWASDVAGGLVLGGFGLGICLAYAPRGTLGVQHGQHDD